jgi:hypothetical protein
MRIEILRSYSPRSVRIGTTPSFIGILGCSRRNSYTVIPYFTVVSVLQNDDFMTRTQYVRLYKSMVRTNVLSPFAYVLRLSSKRRRLFWSSWQLLMKYDTPNTECNCVYHDHLYTAHVAIYHGKEFAPF